MSNCSFRYNVILTEFHNNKALVVLLKPFNIISCSDESCIIDKNETEVLNHDHYVDFIFTYIISLRDLNNLYNQQKNVLASEKIFIETGYFSDSCVSKIFTSACQNISKIKTEFHYLLK